LNLADALKRLSVLALATLLVVAGSGTAHSQDAEFMRQLANSVGVERDADGRYAINECPTVWIENYLFYVCDTFESVIAFSPRHDAKYREIQYYLAVWNTSGTPFDFHPQSAQLFLNGLWQAADRTMQAYSYAEVEQLVRKKQRRAAVALAISYSLSDLTAHYPVKSTTSSPTGTVVSTTITSDPARIAEIQQQRLTAFQVTLNRLAQEDAQKLRTYAKSNTLADGMMTAGLVLFPKVSIQAANATDNHEYVVEISTNGQRFVYRNEGPEDSR